MLYKRLKSIVLLSLSLFSICHAADNEEENNSSMIIPIIKYCSLAALPVSILCYYIGGKIYHYVKKSKLDKLLEQDLEKNVECNIINYLDGDKISLTKDEIKRYSSAYNDLLFELNENMFHDFKKEEVYDKLKACALFLIRTDARLKRKSKKLTNKAIDEDVKRYQGGTNSCILSKLCFENNSGNISEREDYLNYVYTSYKLTVSVGPEGPWGWVINFSPKELTFRYENCKPI